MAVWFVSAINRDGRTFDGYIEATDDEAAKAIRRLEAGKVPRNWTILLYRRDGADILTLVESSSGTG